MRITREEFDENLEKRGLAQRDLFVLISNSKKYKKYKGLSSKLSKQGRLFTVWCSLACEMFFDVYDNGGFDV